MKRDEQLGGLLLTVIIGIVIILLIIFFKMKGGVLGFIIGVIATMALIYWVIEIKRILKEQKAPTLWEREWFYDLIEEEENVTFVAKVPGPAHEVKVKVVRGVLEVRGGEGFLKRIRVPKNVVLEDNKYVNGILQVRLRKTERLRQQEPSGN
ncbi:MAG: Hsp20/alpha crystallin family protein [Thermoproteota archaeon]|nr:Hsp20/alpha crystallin family protein [Candidatus Brockarchaeota archaeon]